MNLNKLIEDTLVFNKISGSDKETSLPDIDNQLFFIVDEVQELAEACNHFDETGKDEGEIVKEALDVLVCTIGLLQKMQSRGYDIMHCANVVGENNLSKYPSSYEDAMKSLKDLADKGVNAFVASNPEYNVHVIRDVEHRKVRKPSSYQKVDSKAFKKG